GGAASADPEKAMQPIASADSVKARREFAKDARILGICRPLFDRLVDWLFCQSGVSFPKVNGQRFRDVCSTRLKRFRAGKDLFHDGFATPDGANCPKRFCNSLMMSHA